MHKNGLPYTQNSSRMLVEHRIQTSIKEIRRQSIKWIEMAQDCIFCTWRINLELQKVLEITRAAERL